ncbi:MAG: hypothetical protein WC282_00095 [Bacilli bacterium]|jgi:tRNA nucleotidyltransferase (CCA-adding enzyme)
MDKSIFLDLCLLFAKHGFALYMIGGTSRDYLLNREVLDYDFVTDATPEQMATFLVDIDDTFARFGTICLIYKNQKIDIVTFREEGEYTDFRHPESINYIRDIRKDHVRRDFTINALYIDQNFKVYDFAGGLKDLQEGVIRLIGDPDKRLKEDPLRILRAERFAKKLNFRIEEKTFQAMERNRHLLSKINADKIREEIIKQK